MSHHHHHSHHQPSLDRRSFLRLGGMGLASALVSAATPGIALAATPGGAQKTFIHVFMRGGADSLQFFPPADDPNYQAKRPTTRIASKSVSGANSALDFIGKWQLNPLLAPLQGIPNLTLAPGVSFEGNNRSHFDCQKWIERGYNNEQANETGLFNRYLQIAQPVGPVQGISAGSGKMPYSLFGPAPTVAISTLESFAISNNSYANGTATAAEDALRGVIAQMKDTQNTLGLTRRAEASMLDAIVLARQVAQSAPLTQTFSKTSQGQGLRLIAQLLKANVPVSIAAIDWSNPLWDTHSSLPGTNNTANVNIGYNMAIANGASDLLAFYNELGPDLMKNVVVLVGSEFGRTIQENGTGGTDHGVGGSWFAFGGSVPKGHNLLASADYAIADVLKLGPSGGDYFIPFKANIKDLMGEIMVKHLGLDSSQLVNLFPNHSFTDNKMLAA